MKNVMIYFSLMFLTLCLSINLMNAQNIDLYGSRMGNLDTVSGYNDMIFVKINPFTATVTMIDTLTNVNSIATGSSTFDHSSHHYIFKGGTAGGSSLFVLDTTGTILSENPAMNHISGFQYDLKNQVLYALFNDSLSNFHFSIFNPDNGSLTLVNALNIVSSYGGGSITFNSNTSKYIFAGNDTNNIHRLFTINALNGTVESSIATGSSSLGMLQYDNNANKLFGLYQNVNDSPLVFYFVEIDTLTANITIMDTLNEINSISSTSSVYDQTTSSFIFVGRDTLDIIRMYVINTITGQIISKLPIEGSVGEIECDNTKYAKNKYHSTSVKNMITTPNNFSIFPNPNTGIFKIDFTEDTPQDVVISVTNNLNQLVYSKTYNNYMGTFSNFIELKNIANGIYNLSIKIGDKTSVKQIAILK